MKTFCPLYFNAADVMAAFSADMGRDFTTGPAACLEPGRAPPVVTDSGPAPSSFIAVLVSMIEGRLRTPFRPANLPPPVFDPLALVAGCTLAEAGHLRAPGMARVGRTSHFALAITD